MDTPSYAAAIGLVAFVSGVVLVNVVSTPRAALVGGIVAVIGVLALAFVAVRKLFQ
jgi:hypothetical protein